MFKKIFNNDDNNNINNNKNISNKNNDTDFNNYIYKTYNKDIEINMDKENKKLNIKIPPLSLRNKTYDKKIEENYLTNRRNIDHCDTSSNYFETNYIEYLFKLYQPKKKFKAFLYNLSNLKVKK